MIYIQPTPNVIEGIVNLLFNNYQNNIKEQQINLEKINIVI